MNTGIVDWVLGIGTHYPDLLAVILGTLSAYCASLITEAFFLPPEWSQRRQQRATVLVQLFAAIPLATLIWGGIDGADSLETRVMVSTACSLIGPLFYPALARYATSKFPSIATAWQKQP